MRMTTFVHLIYTFMYKIHMSGILNYAIKFPIFRVTAHSLKDACRLSLIVPYSVSLICYLILYQPPVEHDKTITKMACVYQARVPGYLSKCRKMSTLLLDNENSCVGKSLVSWYSWIEIYGSFDNIQSSILYKTHLCRRTLVGHFVTVTSIDFVTITFSKATQAQSSHQPIEC